MATLSLTYQQSVFKRYHSDKHFSEFLPTGWRQKSTGIDTERNYVTVTLCIGFIDLLAAIPTQKETTQKETNLHWKTFIKRGLICF